MVSIYVTEPSPILLNKMGLYGSEKLNSVVRTSCTRWTVLLKAILHLVHSVCLGACTKLHASRQFEVEYILTKSVIFGTVFQTGLKSEKYQSVRICV